MVGSERSFGRAVLLSAASLLATVFVLEIGFRVAGYDFEKKARTLETIPIYYRKPMLPVEEGCLRRRGPDQWEGKVLTSMRRWVGVPDQYLPEERALSVSYDKLGFRNPEDLDDWTVVVVGDSFTELGYLAYEDLFTSRVAAQLNLRVKNLGVSYAGPFTYLCYLRAYGRATSTRHAVMAFFEGNDLDDLVLEDKELRKAREPSENTPPGAAKFYPPAPELKPQSSFLKALHRLATSDRKEPRPTGVAWNFATHFFTGGGARVPVSIAYSPPWSSAVSDHQRNLLGRALNGWARVARSGGMKPWLLYIPCKQRALYGYLTEALSPQQRIAPWEPTDLPAMVQSMAEERGIEFIDSTPALQAETARGRLTYNTIYDSHVNRLGSLTIARVLAEALDSQEGEISARISR